MGLILKDPIPFGIIVPMSGGLNKRDGSEIADHEFQVAEKVRFDDNLAEKAPGFVQQNAGNQLESGAKLDGVWKSIADNGTARSLAICNGKVYESSNWTAPIYTGLTAGKRCTFVDYQGRTYISNGYDDPIVYNPKTNVVEGKIGIMPPRQLLKVAYFESDESWTGGAADKDAHVLDEYEGDSLQGWKLTATATNTESATRTVSLNLSAFGDGISVGGWDQIVIDLFHRIRGNVSEVRLYFQTSAGNYYSASVGKAELDPEVQRDYQWTHLKLRRNAFTATGAPSWANITLLKIEITASADGTAIVTFDNWHIEQTAPVPGKFQTVIANFEESDETWQGDGTIEKPRSKAKDAPREGACILKIPGDGAEKSAYRTISPAMDLTTWLDGRAGSDSDEVWIYVFCKDTTKVTSWKLWLETSAGNYFYKDLDATDLNTGTDTWTLVTLKRSDFLSNGAPNWNSIAKIYIKGTITAPGYLEFDAWMLVEKADALLVTGCEDGDPGETWTGGYWCLDKQRYLTMSRETHQKGSIKEETIEVVFNEKDLTQWGDGSTSTTDDLISFWHKVTKGLMGRWVKTIVRIDCNAGDFATDFYKFEVDQGYLDVPGKSNPDGYVYIRKADFERIGATGGKDWSTVKGVSWEIHTTGHKYAGWVKVAIDDVRMRRKTGLEGRFRWAALFKSSTMKSALSRPSDWFDLNGERAYLHHVPVSGDSRVTQREVYRQNYAEEGQPWRYVFTIADNTTTEHFDDIPEGDEGLTTAELGVPSGTILSPKGKIIGEHKDQLILLQDPSNLKRLHYADKYYTYSWSELNAQDFPTELRGGVTHFDNLFMFLANGRHYRIEGELNVTPPTPLGEMFRCVSPWGIAKVEEEVAVVVDKDIRIFNGYESRSIGEEIEEYLDPASYKIHESFLFYFQKHLYYSVETIGGGTWVLLECYVPEVKWELRDEPLIYFTLDPTDLTLMAGGNNGYVYKLNDDTFNANMKIRSKDFSEVDTGDGKGFAFHEKELQEVRVIVKAKAANGGALTMKFYANGADTSVSKTIPSTGHLATVYTTYIIPLTGIEKVIIGELLGFELSHNTAAKDISIKAVLLRGQVLPLEQEYTG